ncbi:tumor necrosis factor alpha-induced protein 2-like isoform X2 [Cynoglossus semilaevis]|uniref:tumor necrosis factor alpha-induced protein 2-like isoform X2 n=1 Tax=Cynoglossus semilaevis TaxID=244447 RepID=UPI0007DCA3D2|nr:tumor necrosis factor alpha-induced protein 2-like isoform X2 [Cynoglossus semilaevis]
MLSCCQVCREEEAEENQERRQWKNPRTFCRKNKNQRQEQEEHQQLFQQVTHQEEQMEEVSSRLLEREAQLFSQDRSSEDDKAAKEQLHKDFEDLKVQLQTVVEKTFSDQPSALRSAVICIQQQETQDQLWTSAPEDTRPPWRPLKCRHAHDVLLQNIVSARLRNAREQQVSGEQQELSSVLKRQVYNLGKQVEEDLLMLVQNLGDSSSPHLDVLNTYARVYHQGFSDQLIQIAGSELDVEDCVYLLFMVNHYYPESILKHKDLGGLVQTSSLGSLLLEEDLTPREEQYLTHKEDQIKTWFNMALNKERETWTSGKDLELIDSYYFSPFANDAIQMVQSFLNELGRVVQDQNKGQRVTAHLESFLRSYEKSLAAFVKTAPANVASVVKGQLVCEQQLRDYITNMDVVSEQQRSCCLRVLDDLKTFESRFFTAPIHVHLKLCVSGLWTSSWINGSLPVVQSLLESLDQHLENLKDLRSDCREVLLRSVHEDLVLQYLKKLMKSSKKSTEQQVIGAQQMKDDAGMINEFFKDGVMCLQDPNAVQLEMISLSRKFPDISNDHVVALLLVKKGLSGTNIRSILRSVKENRVSSGGSPTFFCRLRLKPTDKLKTSVFSR